MRNTHLMLEEKTLAPGTEWTPSPQAWMFLRVRQGEGYLLRSPSPQCLSQGDMLVTARAGTCPLRASQLSELQVQYFHICPDLMAGALSPFERQHLERSAAGSNGKKPMRFYPSAHERAQQFTQLSEKAARRDSLLLRFQLLHLAAPILTEDLPPQPAIAVKNGLTARDRFEQLFRQMTETEVHDLAPAEAARRCGCSARHFSRLYRAHFGHSFLSKKIELRLHKAQQLLRDTDDKIIDVAMESGFQHVGLFTSVFKQRFRVTPSQWRRRQRQKPRG